MGYRIIEHDRRETAAYAPLLRFTVAEVAGAGPLMIALSDEGLCWAGMTQSVARLQKDFPHSVLLRDDGLQKQARAIGRSWKNNGDFPLPLVLFGTAFERAVWKQLLKIPYGRCKSYGEIAAAIKNPGAVRAVGTAVGRNPVTLLVPCHRVLAQSKAARLKFGWGPAAKQRLLAAEGVTF